MRQAGLFVLVSEAYLAAPPTQEMVPLSRGRSHSRFGVESAAKAHAADCRFRQVRTGLTEPEPYNLAETAGIVYR